MLKAANSDFLPLGMLTYVLAGWTSERQDRVKLTVHTPFTPVSYVDKTRVLRGKTRKTEWCERCVQSSTRVALSTQPFSI